MLLAPVCACTWELDLGVSRAKPASITSADHRTSVNATAVEARAPCAASALAEAHRRGAVPDDGAGEGAASQQTYIQLHNYTYKHINIYTYIHIYILYSCIYVYMYIYRGSG
jgi:hypothetical protein